MLETIKRVIHFEAYLLIAKGFRVFQKKMVINVETVSERLGMLKLPKLGKMAQISKAMQTQIQTKSFACKL